MAPLNHIIPRFSSGFDGSDFDPNEMGREFNRTARTISGLAIGLIVGGIVLAIAITAGLFCFFWRRKKRNDAAAAAYQQNYAIQQQQQQQQQQGMQMPPAGYAPVDYNSGTPYQPGANIPQPYQQQQQPQQAPPSVYVTPENKVQ
jgi:type II secretory pathway pseudopilin PulG